MISKYSVKKPFTVLVGVILVIVLGVVSLSRMTTDLLPDMSFQYALIITTDMGASPQEVESDVTAPIESAMATTSNIKNVSSMSYNSYSIVTCEYEQDANMDSVVIEIQQKIDASIQLPEGYHIEYGGQFESEQAASRTLLLTSLMSLLVIFLLLYNEFKNAKESGVILLNLPLALIGGVFILKLTSGEVSALRASAFLRADVVYLSYYALETNVNGGGALSDVLIARGVFSDAAYRTSRAMVTSARIG